MGGGSGGGAGAGGGYKSGAVIGPKSGRAKSGKAAEAQQAITNAYQQVHNQQQAFKSSLMGSLPTTGTLAANAMFGKMKSDLAKGGSAVVAAGTGYAPQGQAYTQAPGMMSDPSLAAQTGLAGSIGQVSSTSEPTSGKGYMGDVVGTVGTNFFGGKVYTGKQGYSPIGKNADLTQTVISVTPSAPDSGGKGGGPDTPTAPVTEPEITPEVTPEFVPDDTVLASKTKRTRFKRVGQGGTILEGFGVLYK